MSETEYLIELERIAADACEGLLACQGDYSTYCEWCDKDGSPIPHDDDCPVGRLAKLKREWPMAGGVSG